MKHTIKYRLRCETEGIEKECWKHEDAGAPTECPTDPGHTIDSDSIVASENKPCITRVTTPMGCSALASFRMMLDDLDAIWLRAWIEPGTYDRMECLIEGNAAADAYVDLGVYACDNGNPPRPTGSLLCSTGKLSTDGHNHSFWIKSLSQELVVESGDFYWLALAQTFVVDKLKLSGTGILDRAWMSKGVYVLKEGYGNTLGALPGSYDEVDSALPHIGLLEKEV